MNKILPFVSVIIPAYHDWDRLKLCVEALRSQSYPADRFEVVIVNNDPEDHPSVQLNLPGNTFLASETKPGSYAARNKGIRRARGEVLAFTDSDCIPAVDWLEKGVGELVDGAERVGGDIELFYKGKRLTLAEKYEKAFAFCQEGNVAEGASVTANMFTWRRSFDEVGLFNELLQSGGDLEWGRRARDAGIGITYAPGVVVHHPTRHCFRDLLDKHRRIAGGRAHIWPKAGPVLLIKELCRGFMPPIFAYFRLRNRSDLSIEEKLSAFGVLYFVKIYCAWQVMLVLLKLRTPKRA